MSEFVLTPKQDNEPIFNKKGVFGSIAGRIIFYASLMFFVMTCVLAAVSYKMYWISFYNYSNKMCLTSNALAADVIDGNLVEHFAKTLTVDEKYEKFAKHMDALKAKMDAKFFYILVDNGVQGMYTYIYDATHAEEFPGEKYALGRNETVDEYEGAETVLATGKGFDKAVYYNERYGELYYAYAPIFNSARKVVAFVGTDIDIAPLHAQMNDYRMVIVGALAASLLSFSLICFLMVRYTLSLPLRHITEGARRLSQGDVDLSLPPSMLGRRDEIGSLAIAFTSMSGSISRLLLDIESIMRAVRDGLLGRRADVSQYQGDYKHIISGVNKTLDVVCRHFDAISDSFCLMDQTSNPLHCNKAMRRFAEMHGTDMDTGFLCGLLHGNTLERVRELASGKGEASFSAEISLTTTEGDIRNYIMLLLRVGEDDEAAPEEPASPCFMLMLSDVTMIVRSRNEAEAASLAKSAFLSHMSHEIRTPMNAISGMTQIASSLTDIGKIRGCLTHIEDSCGHLLGIVNDVLDLAKIEAGKLTLDEMDFSLSEDMRSVAYMMEARAGEKGLSISLRLENIEHDIITGDSLRLNQVLLNMLSNAVKFSPQGGEIRLEAREESFADGYSVFKFMVSDRGIGIDPRDAERIFQPFEQADSRISRAYGGTGLGLGIARDIVSMMGGKISLESEPGKGSIFSFSIRVPARDAGEHAGRGTRELSGGSLVRDYSGRRALIVDDIDINREIIMELLRDTGMEMDEAETGREAVEKVATSPVGWYSVIFMDMQMPVLDGCSATREIRALERQDAGKIFIAAMTANVLKEDMAEALNSGMNFHLSKPIVLSVVLDMLDGVFARHGESTDSIFT